MMVCQRHSAWLTSKQEISIEACAFALAPGDWALSMDSEPFPHVSDMACMMAFLTPGRPRVKMPPAVQRLARTLGHILWMHMYVRGFASAGVRVQGAHRTRRADTA